MPLEDALEKLSQKTLSLEEVAAIFSEFQGDKALEAALAMNLSLRTSVYDEQPKENPLMSHLLEKLAHSQDMSARWAVAKNPYTPVATLEYLCCDPINLVRALVATNPKTPQPILKRFFSDEKIVRDGLSGNPSTPLKILMVLADDNDTMTRLRVVENPSCTKALCQKLANDEAPNVKMAAKLKLERLFNAD